MYHYMIREICHPGRGDTEQSEVVYCVIGGSASDIIITGLPVTSSSRDCPWHRHHGTASNIVNTGLPVTDIIITGLPVTALSRDCQ